MNILLWPGRNTLRPLIVEIWAVGVALMGVFMLAGIKART